MAPDRQWLITKVLGVLLGLSMVVSSGIGAANLVSGMRRDINRNERTQQEHETEDNDKWSRAWEQIDETEDSVQELSRKYERTDTKLEYIIKGIDELKVTVSKQLQ